MNAAVTAFLGAVCAAAVIGLAYVALRIERAVRQNTRAVRQAAKLLASKETADDLRRAGAELKRIADFAEPMSRRVEGLKASVDAFYAVAVSNLGAGAGKRSPAAFEDEEGSVYGPSVTSFEPLEGASRRSVVAGLDDTETLQELGQR